MKHIEIFSLKWSVHENLLQWYRSIFISSQSFLLAVAALFYNSNEAVFLGVSAVALIIILYIWLPVVISRHRFVDYYKYAVELDKEDIEKLCTDAEYVENESKREEANNILKLETNWRLTRKKMDGLIPALFLIIWILMMFTKYRSIFICPYTNFG